MKFDVVIADPCWSFADNLTMSEVKRGASSQYPVLDNLDIQDLQVREIVADDAILVLWCPAALLSSGLLTMQSWSFRQVGQIVWVKTSVKEDRLDADDVPEDLAMAFGMGRTFRGACEFALVGVRGKILSKLEDKSIRNVFLAPNLKHSQKPILVHEALEKMFPKSRPLELFSRGYRAGWTSVGLECPETPGEDIRTSIARLIKGEPFKMPEEAEPNPFESSESSPNPFAL